MLEADVQALVSVLLACICTLQQWPAIGLYIRAFDGGSAVHVESGAIYQNTMTWFMEASFCSTSWLLSTMWDSNRRPCVHDHQLH